MDQFFIYFRYTPKGLKFFVSRELSPQGESKKLLRKDDIRGEAADALLSAFVGFGRQLSSRARPDLQELTEIVRRRTVGFWKIKNVIFLPAQGVFGNRVLVQFED